MIDVSNWKEFRIGDLFDIHPTKAYELTNAKLLDDGENPVVANSAYSNGVVGYSTQQPTEKGNMVTFSDTVDVNTMFYQHNDFVGYPHVQGLYPIKYEDKWNEYTYLFFVSVFRCSAIRKGFDYGNKFRRDIAVELMIKLPITSSGEPDWDYMESYMKAVMDESEKSIANLKKIDDTKQSIEVNGWGEFRVGDLLNMEKQIELSPIDAFNNNTQNEITYPFYGQSSVNNGIIDYYYLGEDLLNNINSEHCIMIHSNTHLAYYVNTPFYLKDGHGATTIFTNDHLTESSTFFIITVLNKAMFDKFDYDTKATKEKLENLIIKLPITSTGEPDWQYMESYMKAVMDESENNLAILKTL